MSLVSGSLAMVVRRLRSQPTFALVVVLTLGVGIGANTAMFSVVNGVLLKPLPFDEPGRLVSIWNNAPGVGWTRGVLAPAQYFTYRDEARSFEDIAVWADRSETVTGDGEPERVAVLMVTDGFLPVLRIQPLLGRPFSREDDSRRGTTRVMLGYGYWRQKFGGDPSAVGRFLNVGGAPHEIIGVLPQAFKFLDYKPAMLLPFRFDRAGIVIEDFSYRGLARLKPDVTLEQANRDVARMIPLTAQKFPMSPTISARYFEEGRFGPDVHPLSNDAAGNIDRALWVLMGTVGIVLLIACGNVANLFLVRADGRRQEFAVRSALGASRGRIARELLAESMVLGAAGGAVGIALACVGIRVVATTAPPALPRVDEISMEPIVLLFAAGLSILASILFGLVPALKFARPCLLSLKDGGRSASGGRERNRARNALVVCEIALALVLLVASGLMVRTFRALRNVNPGFSKPREVLLADISIPPSLAADAEDTAKIHEQILQRIQQIPGLAAVALTSSVCLEDRSMKNPALVEDFPRPAGQAVLSRLMRWISPGFFEAMGNPIVAGRDLTWADVHDYAPVVLVNEVFAREYWKEPSAAIGRRVRASPGSPWREIVGVVGNELDRGLASDPPAILYYPFLVKDFWRPQISAQRFLIYVIRSPLVNSPGFVKEVREALWSVNRDIPLASVRTLEEVRADSMARTSFALVMLGIAASIALLLGVIGIYGVIAHAAAQRTREVGIRLALGAEPRDVRGLLLLHGLRLTGLGVAAGLGTALALSHTLSALLFGVTPTDAATYAAVSGVLAAIAMLATWLPARRAARMDPLAALRAQ